VLARPLTAVRERVASPWWAAIATSLRATFQLSAGAAVAISAAAIAAGGRPVQGIGTLGAAAFLAALGARSVRNARARTRHAILDGRVRRALRPLRAGGWQIRHSVRWLGAGRIHHVLTTPGPALSFAVELLTTPYRDAAKSRAQNIATWLEATGAVAIAVCVEHERKGEELLERGVVVTDVGRLAERVVAEHGAFRDALVAQCANGQGPHAAVRTHRGID
jgi:hypothetical protein